MTERHDLYEMVLREPPAPLDHVVVHHGYLGHGSANIDETSIRK